MALVAFYFLEFVDTFINCLVCFFKILVFEEKGRFDKIQKRLVFRCNVNGILHYPRVIDSGMNVIVFVDFDYGFENQHIIHRRQE